MKTFFRKERKLFNFLKQQYEEGEKHFSWWSFNKGYKKDHFSKFFIFG